MPLFITVAILTLVVVIAEFACYTLLIPDLSQKPLHRLPLDRAFGICAYIVAYTLSLLRAPLGLLPYLAKMFIFFVLKVRYESAQSTYFREVINMLGDFVNLGLTIILILIVAGPPGSQLFILILYIPVGAELVRLITERIPITFSAIWQLLPHRKIACAMQSHQQSYLVKKVAKCFARYCRYYCLSDQDRTEYVLKALKQRASCNSDLSSRLAYIQAFRIIPQRYGLRGGKVRDVARAEVFIHRIWTNDPWLLAGMAMRRAPWMFDPRYLRRPFYYMTEANRLATLLVLEHARYAPPYAVFQFGHEMRVARLHAFYGLLRWFGADIEEKVSADGTFQFDQIIFWLARRSGHRNAVPKQRFLFTDEEVIADMLCRHDADGRIEAMDVAIRYTYPVKYVEEVLLESIEAAKSMQAGHVSF